ncbi:MAG: hypothetical protein KJT03_19160 [Verrucomicrobiae bacterium]|nr:hypothetical protein [Verrucomicrobiae bacterium]
MAFALWAILLISTKADAANLDPRAEAILNKARAFISDEATLNKVKSLRFEGTITDPNGETATIVINLQRPYKLLQSLTRNDGIVEEFGLNDYEGWVKRYREDNPDIYGLLPVDVIRLKRLRANTYEGLNFFSTQTNFSRKIEYLGTKELNGKQVEMIKILYGSAHFIRYFDKNTGELLLSEIESGESIEEQGEIKVAGIVFPKYLITRKDGEQISHLEFQKIEVNPKLDESLFQQPALPGVKNK